VSFAIPRAASAIRNPAFTADGLNGFRPGMTGIDSLRSLLNGGSPNAAASSY